MIVAKRFVIMAAKFIWEAQTAPGIPPFARRQGSTTTSPQLRKDNNAGFKADLGGFLFRKRIWFVGTGCPPVEFTPAAHGAILEFAGAVDRPAFVARSGDRQWWYWRGAFYWDSGNYAGLDVKALLHRRERRKMRELSTRTPSWR
jgi:hypothetical protein